MKIILINPPSNFADDDHLEPQLGLLYIASVLRKNNEVEIYEMTGCKNEEDIQKKIRNIPEGNIYGFTTYCTNYNYIKECIKYLRLKYRRNYKPIILGGPNASALPEFTLEDSKCDYIVVGEGEDAFLEIVNALKSGINIPRIIYGKGREDIDSYPFPAYDLVNLDDFTRVLEGERVISVISSRGCKYNCTHCNSVIMGGGSKGKRKVRYRSIQNVIDELKYLKSLGYKSFRFNDDIFTVNPNLREFLLELKKLNITYRIFARIEQLTDETCKLLAESGCHHIAIGLESLNPPNLKFLRKHTQLGLEKEHLNNVRKYGMISRVYFICGLPYDNDKSVEKYFGEANKLPFDEFSVYPLIPYPGTEIWKNPQKYGYEIIDKDFTKYIQIGKDKKTCYALKHDYFSPQDVERWMRYIYELFESKVHQGSSKVAK